jgi:hypothetical protein
MNEYLLRITRKTGVSATPPKGYKIPLTVWQKIKSFLRLGGYGKKWQLELTDEVKDFS